MTPEEFANQTDPKLLNLTRYIVGGGDRVSQYGAGPNLLSEITKQIPKKDWAYHIVTLGFDNISYNEKQALCKYTAGQCSIVPATESRLKQLGFIAPDGSIPEEVMKRCKFYMKYIWDVPLIDWTYNS